LKGFIITKYWLDLFTGKTWEEFLKNGGNVSGFRDRRKKLAQTIHPGDYLLCYLTGISRFVGVLKVKSDSYYDNTKIWSDEEFPIRFNVELVYKLKPENAIPVLELRDKLSIFKDSKSPTSWIGHFRGSPAEFTSADGEAIIAAIKNATINPVNREYDPKSIIVLRKPMNQKATSLQSLKRKSQ
jgi:predicted RNA-binding protein